MEGLTREKQIVFLEDLHRHRLNLLGEKINREGLLDTPRRLALMDLEISEGLREAPPKLTVFPNKQDGLKVQDMICDEGYFFSSCEHHLAPFFGKYYFAYIPEKHVLGISKIGRVVKHFSRKFQVQERLSKEVVDYIEAQVKPRGIALILKARHLCKEMRGLQMYESPMTSSTMRGSFKENINTRQEFLRLVGL